MSIVQLGCSTQAIKVESLPEGAEVAIRRPDGQATVLGKTPITLEPSSQPELFHEMVDLEISKAGYSSKSILIPKTMAPTQAKIFVTLKENGVGLDDSQSMSEISRITAQIMSEIRDKKYDQAEKTASFASIRYPNVSVFYALSGNIYYLTHQFSKALDAYRRSRDLDVNNVETLRMIEKLSKLEGAETKNSKEAKP